MEIKVFAIEHRYFCISAFRFYSCGGANYDANAARKHISAHVGERRWECCWLCFMTAKCVKSDFEQNSKQCESNRSTAISASGKCKWRYQSWTLSCHCYLLVNNDLLSTTVPRNLIFRLVFGSSRFAKKSKLPRKLIVLLPPLVSVSIALFWNNMQ